VEVSVTAEHTAVPAPEGRSGIDAFGQAAIGMALIGLDGRFLKVNPALCRMLGRTDEQLRELSWDAVTHVEDRPGDEDARSRLAERELNEVQRLKRYLRPDGSTVWGLVSATLVADEAPPCFFTQVQDVSAQMAAQLRLQTVVSHAPVTLWAMTPDGHITVAEGSATSAALERIRDAAGERTVLDVYQDVPDVLAAVRRALAGEEFTTTLEAYGSVYRTSYVPVRQPNGDLECVVGVATDVTELHVRSRQQAAVVELGRRALDGLAVARLRHDAAMTLHEQLGVEVAAVCELEPDGRTLRLVAATGTGEAAVGLRSSEVDGTLAGLALKDGATVQLLDGHDETLPQLGAHGLRAGVAVLIGHPEDRVGVLAAYTASPRVFSVEEVDFVRSVANVLAGAVQRHRVEEEATHRSMHDDLTDLPNRSLFLDRLSLALTRERRTATRTAVLYVDLDGFKAVNDSLGHDMGDALLRLVAIRLARTVRAADTVARVAGDEFAVICADLDAEEDAPAVAARVVEAIAEPVTLAGRLVTTTASVGLAVARPGVTDAERLLSGADAAMYVAKRRGKNRVEVFDEQMRGRVSLQLQTERDLREAVLREQLDLAYRPIATLDGVLVGAEALVQWRHPTRGLLGFEQFHREVESSGLSRSVGGWALRIAVAAAEDWQAALERRVRLVVAVSPRQLRDQQFVHQVRRTLAEGPLAPDQLCLGITESAAMDDLDTVRPPLESLHALGVRLCIDNFGIGYSSLNQVRQLPVDSLRIAGSLVASLVDDAADQALVAAVIQLGHTLDLEVGAAGVDTPAHITALRALGCDSIQGDAVGPASASLATVGVDRFVRVGPECAHTARSAPVALA